MEEKPWFKTTGAIVTMICTIIGGAAAAVTIYKDVKPVNTISGTWTMTFKVQETSYAAYANDVYVYELYVSQNGEVIEGKGEQKRYNDKEAPSHFKVDFVGGKVKGDKVSICYTLHGTRQTEGNLNLQVDPNNKKHLTGTFKGGDANKRGIVDIVIE